MSTTKHVNHSPRLVGAAVLLAGATMGALAGAAGAASAGDQPEKVFVCKYVGTPHVDERLQTGNNPIEVSVHAIPIYTGQPASALVGREFADAQGRSIVIAVSPVRGGGQGDEPTIEDCPPPDGPPEQPVPVKVTGTPTLTDPCGPNNEVLSTAPTGVVFTPVDMGTFIRVTVSAAPGYVLDQAQTVFDLAVNDAACPTNPVVLGEEATTNNGGNGGNGGDNGGPDVLGEQAFADNEPAAAAQQPAAATPAGQVPTVINAGTAGAAPAYPLAPAAIALFGVLMGLTALVMRRGLGRAGGSKA